MYGVKTVTEDGIHEAVTHNDIRGALGIPLYHPDEDIMFGTKKAENALKVSSIIHNHKKKNKTLLDADVVTEIYQFA
jgi:hypothetical protein